MSAGTPRAPLLAGTAAANVLAFLPPATVPWLMPALVHDWGWAASEGGALASAQLGALGLVAVLLGGQAQRFARARWVAAPALAIVLACAALTGGRLPVALALALVVAIGAAAGVACVAANGLLARADDPQRQTADMWTATLLVQAALWLVTPRAAERAGSPGLFAVLGLCAALCLLAALPLMAMRAAAPAARRGAAAAAPAPAPAAALTGRCGRRAGALVLLCTAAFWLRDSLIWSLAELRATALGIDAERLSWTLAAAMVLGMAGPLLARRIGRRWGLRRTALAALLWLALVMVAIAAAASPVLYLAGFVAWPASSVFAWTYVTSLALEVDAAGRLAALAGGTVFAASAAGPAVGTLLLERHPQAGVAAAVTLLTLMTLGTLMALARASGAPAAAARP
jgi:hypothetical protein